MKLGNLFNRKEGGTKVGRFLRRNGGAEGVLDTISSLSKKGADKIREVKSQTGLPTGANNDGVEVQPDDNAPIFGLPPMAAYSIAAVVVVLVLLGVFLIVRKRG